MMLALALGAALAVQPSERSEAVAPSTFDLLPGDTGPQPPNHAVPLVPHLPRNLDTRNSNAPEAELRLAMDGPVIAVGAMGGRRAGRPKLAHVALDWSF